MDHGDLGAAADAEADYHAWIQEGGFKARDKDDSPVVKLDTEQDRYLVLVDGAIERWRKV